MSDLNSCALIIGKHNIYLLVVVVTLVRRRGLSLIPRVVFTLIHK